MTQRDVSVFDVIGPIMVGPSSSHTAGAVRLGQMGRTILGEQPNHATIELHGSFAETGQGHGTTKAIIAGLLGMATDDDGIKDSFAHANLKNMTFEFVITDLGDDVHPNTAKMTLTAGERTINVSGASIGGGQIQVTEVQGYHTNFSGEYETLLVLADDRPGTINAITSNLLQHDINVAFFKAEREKRKGKVLMVIETDEPLPEAVVESILAHEWAYWARTVGKIAT